jgi:hypothetical protein
MEAPCIPVSEACLSEILVSQVSGVLTCWSGELNGKHGLRMNFVHYLFRSTLKIYARSLALVGDSVL